MFNALLTSQLLSIIGQTTEQNSGTDFSSFITAIAAIFNLFLVIYFYKNDKRERIEQRAADHTERNEQRTADYTARKHNQEIQSKAFWYRRLIMEKKIDIVENFFQKSTELFKSLEVCEGKDKLDKKKEFQESRSELICQVNDYIRIMDNNFGEYLDTMLDRCEDFFTDKYELFNSEDKIYKKKIIISDYKKLAFGLQKNYLILLYSFEIYEYDFKKMNEIVNKLNELYS